MTTWPNNNKPALGNTNWYYNEFPFTNDSRLTWDVTGGIPTARRPGSTVFMNKFEDHSTFNVANLTWVTNRFDLATSNRDKFDYGAFLLMEEVFHPAENAKDSWKNQKLSTWSIQGKHTFVSAGFADVEVKLLKPWIIENKGQAWNQSWWDDAKANNKYDDPLIREWSIWYGVRLYQAWHQHMRALGKKSGIIGVTWWCRTDGCFSALMKSQYPSPIWEYVTSNYDALFTAQFPKSLSEVQYSLAAVKSLRNDYNYKGKIIHLLTKDFGSGDPVHWDFNSAVAQAEFNAVAPYVDVIVVYHHTIGWDDGDPYPPLLIQFRDQYNPICTPNWQCESPLNGYEHDTNNCGEARRLNSACNPVTTKKYKCSGSPDYSCTEDVSGSYDTLAACQAACKAPEPDSKDAQALLIVIAAMIAAYFVLKGQNSK